jgi:hypothetical protein
MLGRIERFEPKLDAFVYVTQEVRLRRRTGLLDTNPR